MSNAIRFLLCVSAPLLLGVYSANATITTFAGNDPTQGDGDPRPNSDVALANFAANAGGPLETVDFESQPPRETYLGNTPVTIGPGIHLTVISGSGADIENGNSSITGYNTTPGGSQFLTLNASGSNSEDLVVRFSYDTPLVAWGTYFTGIGTASGTLSVEFNDGTQHTYDLSGGAGGGVQFLGFTGLAQPISHVDVRLTAMASDIIGVDDIVSASAIPAPSAAGVLAAGVLMVRRRRRH